ncbi:hypothetical protein [Baileyella intestinalis]|jgi:hypothetical protein|uniref:hypothetical protein n=1 Tax=Baileyella intestinalis TaxID=2606709 RepID=UPI0022E7EB8D|nr:hypothetical protein [Baileyella intestinalis]
MENKTAILYKLMIRKGYPEEFTALICSEMNTEFTADKMISYIGAPTVHRLEDVADEMIAILDLRDRLRDKHMSEYAQGKINQLYREINEEETD